MLACLALVFRVQVMTLHCEAKTKNIKLFSCKNQLSSESSTESYSGEICNVLKVVVQTLEQYFWRISLRSLQNCKKNELLHWYYLRILPYQIENVCVCAPAFSNFSGLLWHGISKNIFI